MKILVTGGAGFIGSHIVDASLAAGHAAFVVDNLSSGSPANVPRGVPLYEVDICDYARLQQVFNEVRPDVVCHQAAQMSVSRSVREPVFDGQVNVMGLLHVFDLAQKSGAKRIVFASSGGVMYGDVTTPAPEETPANPISPYGISKWVGEKYLQFFVREHGITAVALRYANVYGPRQNPHGEAGVMAIFSKRMLAGEGVTINGDGKFDRDYVYGPDVAQANLRAFTANIPGGCVALNVGTGIATDVNQLEAMVRQEVQTVWNERGQKGTVPTAKHGPDRPGDLRSSLVDARKAGELIGWKPGVVLADGIRQTVRWFAEQTA